MTLTTAPGGKLVIEARYASMTDLIGPDGILMTQQKRQLDIVAPASRFRVRNGMVEIDGIDADLGPDGLDPRAGVFRPLRAWDRGVANRFGVPHDWLVKLRQGAESKTAGKFPPRLDIYDETVNRLLAGGTGADGTEYPADGRKFMLRTFRGDPGQPGVIRALLTGRYNPIEHLDILAMAAQTIHEAADRQIREALGMAEDAPVTDADRGMFASMHPDGKIPGPAGGTDIRNINLTEDSMHLRVIMPGITTEAPGVVENYRDPFRSRGGARRAGGWQAPDWHDSARGKTPGTVVAVFVDFLNNTVGQGSVRIVPGFYEVICGNGMVQPKYAVSAAHLGADLPEGVVEWSEETKAASMRTLMLKARDALRRFLTADFLETMIADYQGRAAVEVADPEETIQVVARQCRFTEDQVSDIRKMFMLGGQLTAGGIAQAVTAAAQVQASPDAAITLDYAAMDAMDAAAAHAEAKAKEEAAAAK